MGDLLPIINLNDLGIVEISKKLKANLTITSRELFNRFSEEAILLSYESKDTIKSAVDNNLEPRIKKGREEEITQFFEKIRDKTSDLGFGEEEKEEEVEAEELKSEDIEEEEVAEIEEQETFDEVTGEKEGTLILGDEKVESDLIPITIKEKIELFYNRDGSKADKESITAGLIKIDNKSEKDRLWDIDLKLKGLSNTNIEEESLQIQELDPQASNEFAYTFDATVDSDVTVEEFISTIGDPETESYSLAVNADNEVFMKIKIRNNASEDLTNLKVQKYLPNDFKDIDILNQSIGNIDVREDDDKQFAEWIIDNLAQNVEATLDLQAKVFVENKDTKIKSGEISISYLKPKIVSGMEIASFDAYTNNKFNIITSELDDEPNTYECKFIFENKSDFLIRLVNADVYQPDDESIKYIDIDPAEIPIIPAGGKWESKEWIYTADDEEYPTFKTKVEFFTVANHNLETEIKVNYTDVDLAVAAIDGNVYYSTDKLQSFKVTPFTINSKVTNVGGAEINEVTLVENIQANFLPPKLEEVEVLINGNAIGVSYDVVTIEPDNEDSESEHKVTIALKDMKDSEIGTLKPGDTLEIKYPITAFKPTKDIKYNSDALLTANTYPPGKPLEFKPDPIVIIVEHVRRNIAKGKDIKALENEGEFAVTVTIENLGESDLSNYKVKEKISKGLVLEEISHQPEITEKGNTKTLTWLFETIAAGEKIDIKYVIKPSGEAKVSEVQKDD